MFAVQNLTRVRRPADVPGPTLMWMTKARHNTLSGAKGGLKRAIQFGDVERSHWRVVAITSGGQVKRVIITGDQILV